MLPTFKTGEPSRRTGALLVIAAVLALGSTAVVLASEGTGFRPGALPLPRAEQRRCIVIPAFLNTSDWVDDGIGFAAAAELADVAFATDDFDVVGPSEVQPLLDEKMLLAVDPVNDALVREIAEAVGCPYVAAGRIAEFSVGGFSGGVSLVRGRVNRATTRVEVHLLNAAQGTVITRASGSGSKTAIGGSVRDVRAAIEANVDAARDMIRPAIEEVADALLPAAARLRIPDGYGAGGPDDATPITIVGTNESRFYIDRGENFAVQVGQRYRVIRVLDEIFGTDGTLLDRIVEDVGVIEVTQVLSRSSICTVVEGEAAEGDTVEPLESPAAG